MEGEEERSENEGSFSKASIPKRIAIVIAGATVNIIFGLLVYFILMSTSNTYVTNEVNTVIEGYEAQEIGIGNAFISNTAYAREEESKKGMDGSQITGTASSYARKYALNGLFNIDDTKDADTDEFTKQQQIDDEKVIAKTKVQALNKSIENAGIKDEVVEMILSGYGYTSTSEIKVKDYAQIIQDFKSKKE